MPRNIVVSYNFTDRELVHTVPNYFHTRGGGCDGRAVFVTNDVSAEGPKAIDAEIRRVIDTCVGVLFVIGDDVHNSPWINREAELAISRPLEMVVVRLPETTGNVPNKLKSLGLVPLPWGQDPLCDAINKIGRSG
jgi:hypothetical protein